MSCADATPKKEVCCGFQLPGLRRQVLRSRIAMHQRQVLLVRQPVRRRLLSERARPARIPRPTSALPATARRCRAFRKTAPGFAARRRSSVASAFAASRASGATTRATWGASQPMPVARSRSSSERGVATPMIERPDVGGQGPPCGGVSRRGGCKAPRPRRLEARASRLRRAGHPRALGRRVAPDRRGRGVARAAPACDRVAGVHRGVLAAPPVYPCDRPEPGSRAKAGLSLLRTDSFGAGRLVHVDPQCAASPVSRALSRGTAGIRRGPVSSAASRSRPASSNSACSAAWRSCVLPASRAALLVQVLRQQGRMLLRLEAIEGRARRFGGGSRRHALLPSGFPIGTQAPGFQLKSIVGAEVSLESLLHAGKPLLLFFTNPKCGPCMSLMPEITRWHGEKSSAASIVLVSEEPHRTISQRSPTSARP